MECLRICVQYRPNVTPGTKRGVGACVRPARQSRDCLRDRPLRAPPLFAAVRSAAEPVLPMVARGALAALRRIPTPPPPVASVVVLRILAHMRSHGLGRNTSLKPCARLRNPAVREGYGPVVDAPCPPALYVGYPVSLLRRIRALEPRKARLGAMSVLRTLSCANRFCKAEY